MDRVTTNKNFLVLAAIAAAFLYLGIKGLGWGLPGRARNDIVLPPELRNAGFYDLMIKTRSDIYALSGQSPTGWMAEKTPTERTAVMKSLGLSRGRALDMNGKPEVLANFVRPYLLRSCHSDEQMSLASLAGMNPAKLDLNPRQFVYGGAFIYPLGAWLAALGKSGALALTGDMAYYFGNPDEMAKIFLAGRALNLLFGLAALLLLYIITRKHYNERAALIACALYAVMPGIMFQVHVMKPYVMSMFFSLAVLHYSLEMLEDPERRLNYLLSGAFCGLAAGSMSIFGLIIIAPSAALLLTEKRTIRNAFTLFAASAAAFLITNPYWLLDLPRLAEQLSIYHAGKAHGPPHPLNYPLVQLPAGTGALFLLTAAAGLIAGFSGRRRKDILIAAATALPLAATSLLFSFTVSIDYTRLVLTEVAMLCIPAAVFVDLLAGAAKAKLKWAGYALLLAVLGELSVRSFIVSENFRLDASGKSTRFHAAEWISANIPKGARVGLPEMPEPSSTPPIDFGKYRMSVLFDSGGLDKLDYLICSLGAKPPVQDGRFSLVGSFRRYDSFLGFKYSMGLTSVNPEISIYKLQKRP